MNDDFKIETLVENHTKKIKMMYKKAIITPGAVYYWSRVVRWSSEVACQGRRRSETHLSLTCT